MQDTTKQTPAERFKDWIKDKNEYVNTVTGERRLWHPFTEQLGNELYTKAYKWCRKASDDTNRIRKGNL